MNKKGVSVVIGYVLLIVIAISLSLLVYAWLKNYIPGEPEKCPDSVSIMIDDYSCDTNNTKITITFKNNGLFNLYGFIARVKKEDSEFFYELKDGDYAENYFVSGEEGLKPNEKEIKGFSYANHNQIIGLQVQPFILGKKQDIILCDNAITNQKLEGCV